MISITGSADRKHLPDRARPGRSSSDRELSSEFEKPAATQRVACQVSKDRINNGFIDRPHPGLLPQEHSTRRRCGLFQKETSFLGEGESSAGFLSCRELVIGG
jgi:hypothetical protein